MVPNVALLATCRAAVNPSWAVALLAVPAGILLGLFVVCERRPWLACLLLTPFAMLVPAITFYTLRYRTAVTEAVLNTVVNTDPAEAAGFLGDRLWSLAALTLASTATALLASWLCARARTTFVLPRLWRWALVATAVLGLASFAYLQLAFFRQRSPDESANHRSLALRITTDLQQGYPFGLLVSLGAWVEDDLRLEAATAKIRRFQFHSARTSLAGKRQIYVLVIGESSRRDRWQLFGAQRATNPELSAVQHLIPINHMVSSWPMTIGAVPALLTRKPADAALADSFTEPSVVALMRQVGFETWWISKQNRVGRFNSPITLYAEEAEHVRWLSAYNYDEALSDALPAVLDGSRADLFIVLHMMGSHVPYDLRYPASFKKYVPSMQDRSRYDASYQSIENSYDNTVLYTDHVLARIIRTLEHSGAVTALWYESDHGETLPTASCTETGHGHGFRYEFPIPAFFWYSDGYARAFPAKVAAMRDNAAKRTADNDTFATVSDMSGVHLSPPDVSRSLFSTTWKYRPRLVHAVWQDGAPAVPYDQADLGTGCQLVRSGRSTPLDHMALTHSAPAAPAQGKGAP